MEQQPLQEVHRDTGTGAECANVSAALRAHLLRCGPRIACSRRVCTDFSRTSRCGLLRTALGLRLRRCLFCRRLANKSFRSRTLTSPRTELNSCCSNVARSVLSTDIRDTFWVSDRSRSIITSVAAVAFVNFRLSIGGTDRACREETWATPATVRSYPSSHARGRARRSQVGSLSCFP